jgi:hypothetical protein
MAQGPRPSRWEKAKDDWEWRRLRDHLVVAVVGGALAVVALIVLGSPGAAVADVAIVAGAGAAAVILYAGAQLFWAWLQAPMRLLRADVAAIRMRLEAGTAEPKPKAPDVRLRVLDFARKGQELQGYHSGPTMDALKGWAADASEFLQEHADRASAERFLACGIPGETTLTLQRQIDTLIEIAEKYKPGT